MTIKKIEAYNDYGSNFGCEAYSPGWRGSFVVWVLRTNKGTEYVIGDYAVPTEAQMGEVIARIGPIAYEEGQGLERYQEAINRDAARHQERQAEKIRDAKIVERAVEELMRRNAETAAASKQAEPLFEIVSADRPE